MTGTGIVRRLDDLGRIVIPKEIRYALNIKVGDAMEIHLDTSKNQVTLLPYGFKPDYENMWNELKKNKSIPKDVFETIENVFNQNQ